MEKKDGEIISVELSKLSKQDQLYVQRRVEVAQFEAEEKLAKLPDEQSKTPQTMSDATEQTNSTQEVSNNFK